jgi:hypothetical protein
LFVDSDSDKVLGTGIPNNGIVNHDCELHLLCLRDLDLDSFYEEIDTSDNDLNQNTATRSRSDTATSLNSLNIKDIEEFNVFRPIAVIYLNGIEKGRTAVGNKKMIRSYLTLEPRWVWAEETFILRIPGTCYTYKYYNTAYMLHVQVLYYSVSSM